MAYRSSSGGRLQQEPAGPGPQGGERVLVQVERGEHGHPGPFASLADLPGGGDAVQSWHPYVHHHDVGRALARQSDRGGPVGRLPHDREIGLPAGTAMRATGRIGG